MSNLLTISYGDTPTGTTMLEAALRIMADAGAALEIETVQLGAEMVKLGYKQGFDEEVLNKIRRARALLKAPTVNDVTTNLRTALGDDCAIFEATATTTMLDAAIAMLKHLGQNEVAKVITDCRFLNHQS